MINPFFGLSDKRQAALGKIPGTPRSFPSSESSPQKILFSTRALSIASLATRIPIAIAKSNADPSFLRSAGARLTVIFFVGKTKSLFLMAARTRSALSRQAVSGRPMMLKEGSPFDMSISTSTGNASIPITALDNTVASISVTFLERVLDHFDRRFLITKNENGDHIKTTGHIFNPVSFQIILGCFYDLMPFLASDRVKRATKRLGAARLDLNKHKNTLLFGDEINFSQGALIILK